MASPDWSELAQKFVLPEVERSTKDYQQYFKKGISENQLHNLVFNMQNDYRKRKGYKTKRPQKDIHKLGIVKNASKMLPYIQSKLLQEGKVIEFQREGKNIVRNNVKWTAEEIEIARNSENQGLSIKQIAKRLGRSYASTYQKLKKVMK